MTTEPTAPRLIYCPHRGGLKQVCETPNACAGGADCRRGVDPAVSQTRAGDLPDEFARFIGGNWVRRYGHMIADDPDFVAAAIYRVMRLAMTDPNSFELGLLEGTPMTHTTEISPLRKAVEDTIADLADLQAGFMPWLDQSDAIKINNRLRKALKEHDDAI